jgi:hypothetical protein
MSEETLIKSAISNLISASIGSCSCNTMSPDLVYHAIDCRFSNISLAIESLGKLELSCVSSQNKTLEG